MYQISEITDRQIWEDFIDKHCFTTFMQSWDFGIFENNTGHSTIRVAITDNNNISAICQIVIIKAKKGSFLYIPHGPIFDTTLVPVESYQNADFQFSKNQLSKISEIFQTLYDYTKSLAIQKNCSFVRYNTSLPNNKKLISCTTKSNIVFSPIYLTSENNCVLDISSKDLAAIVQSMRKTTRYSIRKAEKEGVTIVQKPKEAFLTDFSALYDETTTREGFTGFSKSYIRHEYEAFEKDKSVHGLVAEINGRPVAAGLFLKTFNCLFYHQGASNHPKIPAPYLLQWEAIKYAISQGCKYYSFWGTYIPGRTPHSWQGLSLFKHGFGTATWSYIPTFDLVVDWKRYIFTYIIEYLIRIRRGV